MQLVSRMYLHALIVAEKLGIWWFFVRDGTINFRFLLDNQVDGW